MLDELEHEFLQNIKNMNEDYNFIIVHGAGPEISSKLKASNVEAPFIKGLRKTTKPAIEIVETVLSGTKNRELTSKFIEEGVKAVGVKGCDGMIHADFLDYDAYGYVGTAPQVEPGLLMHLLEGGFLPVVAPLGRTSGGEVVNINADTAAAGIAKSLEAEKLIFVTDVPGVMEKGEVLKKLTSEDIHRLIEEKVIEGGMIPKVKGAEEALSENLKEVMITSGKQPIISNDMWQGTIIHKERKETIS